MSSATLPTGNSDARYSTSAALAETEASNVTLTSQVQQNANQLHKVATDAAQTAELKEPQAASAVDKLEENLSHKTNAAAAEGAADVQSAKATASGYVEQAKNLASSAIATAQSYIPSTTTATGTTQTNGASGGITATVQSAIATGKEYLASAQATAKPYVESAAAAAQPHIEKAKGAVLGSTPSTTSGSAVPGKPSEVSASTAPLESGPNVVGNPYPATVTGQTTKVGEL